MQLFYTENTDKEFYLSKEESRHISKVLRKKKGDIINFTDGNGHLLIAKIINSEINKTRVKIIDKINKEKDHNYYLHIAISLTKNMDRFEWFLEKATEIGIDEITPIICRNSERKNVNIDRCNRIMISAIKQSLKFHKPKINKIISFTQFLKIDFEGKKYIAHCKDLKKKELKKENLNKKTLILIGPEGDFSENEIQKTLKNNFFSVSLGNNRLRTETAAIIGVHTIKIKE